MNTGIPPAHTTEDEMAVSPINLELAQDAVCDFLSTGPEATFRPAGYDDASIARITDVIGLLDTVPINSFSKYTGEFLNFGETSPGKRCETHAVNTENGPNWVHFAAIDPKLKIFSDHIVAELILEPAGIELTPLDLFDMAMFTRFGGSIGSEIQPDSDLVWKNDTMNISFLYPASDPRTNPLRTYQLGFRRYRNVELLSGKYDAYVRTIEKNNPKRGKKKPWLNLVLPPIMDPLSVCLVN
jgi:hypothetical protein